VARPGQLCLRMAWAWPTTPPLSWPHGLGATKDGARRRGGGRRRHCPHQARAWSLEAEGKVPATGSGNSCSRWVSWQRTSRGGFVLSAGDEGAAGDGGWRRRGMEAEARRIGTIGRPHSAMKPRCMSAEWGDELPGGFVFLGEQREWSETSGLPDILMVALS
jgi:hypothetical protein